MIIFDTHTHNINSHDGHQTITEQCEIAIQKGFLGIATTDHCELGNPEWDEYCCEHIPLSIDEATKAKEIYKDKLIISVGVEIGQALYNEQRAKEIINGYDLDFILCSCHNANGQRDYCTMDLPHMDIPKLLNNYFDMLEQTSAKCDFDSLAHITYPIRYIQGVHKIKVDIDNYKNVIDKILINLINRGKAMEVNTSGYRQAIGMPMPHDVIIKRYKDLGGKLITLGSDAHRNTDMGGGILQGIELIKNCGFDKYFYYMNRQPIEILI